MLWRKIILVIFVIFELQILNPCAMIYHLNQSAVGLGHFFTLKIASEALGLKMRKVVMVPQLCSG